jgi:O-acetyl-ADP-ribose deacetylase (regulator of RNase III)
MKIIKGNILDVENSLICHQVNCQGVMGAGLAQQIRDEWPEVHESYKQKIKQYEFYHNRIFGFVDTSFLLGAIDAVPVTHGNCVINMFGQDNYGRQQQQTSYKALHDCLLELKNRIYQVGGEYEKKVVCFPYKIGCGLGGGDWEKVSAMLVYFFPNCSIYSLEEVSQNACIFAETQ